MTTQIQFQSFNFNSNAVRVILDPNQEPWFCGTDVCDILGYVNAPDAMKKHCKQAGIAKRYISYPSGKKELTFINEPNLYRLIIKSRKPEAEPFEAWVFEEVLPQIRKTGKYQLEPKQSVLPETITPEEQRQIQNAVKATHQRTGLSYGEIWARIKNKFNVAKYEQIPRSQLRDVLIYIASMSPIAIEKPTLSYSLLYPLALLYYYSAEFHDSMVKQKAEEPKMWGLLNRQCRTMDRVRLAISMLAEELPDPEHKADILAFLEP